MLHLAQLSAILAASFVCVFSQSSSNFFYVSAKGDELWAVDRQYKVNRYDNGTWKQLTNGHPAGYRAVTVGASPDGWSFMCTDAGAVYRWNKDSSTWELQAGAACAQINAMSKSVSVAVTTVDAVWKYSPPAGVTTYSTWVLYNNPPDLTKWTSIGVDGDVWVINKKGLLFRRNNGANTWDPQPIINAETVDAQSADKVVVSTKCCSVYFWNGSTWSKIKIPQCAKQATVGSDNKIYYLDEQQNWSGELSITSMPSESEVCWFVRGCIVVGNMYDPVDVVK